ncbi:MAG TPA: hypothetical protein VGN59_15130 [Acidimicrobiia bacterium]
MTVPTEQLAMDEMSLSWTVAHVVDAALESMRDRTVVSAHDVTDLLLDLRTSLKHTVELEEARGRAACEQPRGAWSTAARRAATGGIARRSLPVPRFLRTRSH